MFIGVLEVLPRAAQAAFSAACIATACVLVSRMQPRVPLGVVVALCSAGIGLVWAMFRITVPAFSRKIGKLLPGLVDLLISALLAGALIAAGATIAAAGTCHALPGGTAIIVPQAASSLILGDGSSNSSSPPSIDVAAFIIPPRVAPAGAGQPRQLPPPLVNPVASTAALSAAAYGRRRARLLQDVESISSSGSSSTSTSSISNVGGGVLAGATSSLRRLLASGSLPANPALLLCSAWDASITMCFINFTFFAISAAIGIVDMRLGKGVLVATSRTAAAKEAELARREGDAAGGVRGVTQIERHDFDGDADVVIVPFSQLARSDAELSTAAAANRLRLTG